MAARFLRTRFWQTVTILRGFAFGGARSDPKVNRKIFYDDSISLFQVSNYMERLNKDAEIGIDLKGVEANQPSKGLKQAAWIKLIDSSASEGKMRPFRRFVMGANEDYIVDPPAIKETAAFVGVDPVLINGPGTHHSPRCSA
jgi:hypothetical protein